MEVAFRNRDVPTLFMDGGNHMSSFTNVLYTFLIKINEAGKKFVGFSIWVVRRKSSTSSNTSRAFPIKVAEQAEGTNLPSSEELLQAEIVFLQMSSVNLWRRARNWHSIFLQNHLQPGTE